MHYLTASAVLARPEKCIAYFIVSVQCLLMILNSHTCLRRYNERVFGVVAQVTEGGDSGEGCGLQGEDIGDWGEGCG